MVSLRNELIEQDEQLLSNSQQCPAGVHRAAAFGSGFGSGTLTGGRCAVTKSVTIWPMGTSRIAAWTRRRSCASSESFTWSILFKSGCGNVSIGGMVQIDFIDIMPQRRI